MTRSQRVLAAAVAAIIVVAAAGWFTLISPQHAKVSKLHAQDAAQQQTNASLQSQIKTRSTEAKNVVAQQARVAAIQQQIPATVGLAAYIRALTAAAAKSGIDLQSVAPGAPAAVTVAKPAAAPTPAPTAAATAAATPAAAGSAPQPVPATAAGLEAIPLQLQIAGGYFEIQQFLVQLEGLQRATDVTSVDLTPGGQRVAPGATTSATAPWLVLKGSISLDVFMTTAPLAIPGSGAPTPSPSH